MASFNIHFCFFAALRFPKATGVCTITGYFAVHSPIVEGDPKKCGPINTLDGIVFLEAFRYAINLTNSIGILPKGITLGYTVYDTCKSTVELKSHINPTLFSEDVKLVGIVGPYSSSEAVLAASVLSVFKTTEISYKASSLELEDRGRYNNFFRTVPSDRYEAQAILAILKHFKWQYVSCINSHERQQGLHLMNKLIEDDGRCIEKQSALPETPTILSYEHSIDIISSEAKAKVVILLTTVEDTLGLMKAAKKKGYGESIVWLGGTGWANMVLEEDLWKTADGAITLNYASHKYDKMFREYFFSLKPQSNNYSNFIAFWETTFDCSFKHESIHTKAPCTGRETLSENKGLAPLTTVGSVIDAVFVYAKALRKGLQETCGSTPSSTCFRAHYYAILGWIHSSLSNNIFQDGSSEDNLTFDHLGGVAGRFDILNFALKDGKQKYNLIGNWKDGRDPKALSIEQEIHWPKGNATPTSSRCSEPCNSEKGQVKKPYMFGKSKSCCWNCRQCEPNDMVSTNDTCVPCGSDFRPDPKRKRCTKLPENSVSFEHPVGIAGIFLSTVGMILTIIVIGLFIYYNKAPIVKASGRELSYFMLIGLCICFAAPIIFLSPPSKNVCAIQRFIAGLSLNFCYAPLLLKTNRLYRIFKNATLSVSRPSLTSPLSQITICLGITSIQILLGVVWTIGDPPKVFRHYPESQDFVMLYCKTDAYIMELNLCVCLVLMLACTWFAFKTRNFPKNFNETKSTMLTMYASCLVWGIFLPIFVLSGNKDEFSRTYTIVLFCDIIAYVTLIGLFAPKIRILFWPGIVTDASQTGVVSRGDVQELKRNTLMSRAILSSYPAVTLQYVNAAIPFESYDGNDISTSTTDLHI